MLCNATKVLARRAPATAATAAKAERSAESQALKLLARRASSRSIATSRARLNAEKPAAEGDQASKPYEEVTPVGTGGFWLGLLGLGAGGVYFVIRELFPKYVHERPLAVVPTSVLINFGIKFAKIGLRMRGDIPRQI